jgi:hypothetical protein
MNMPTTSSSAMKRTVLLAIRQTDEAAQRDRQAQQRGHLLGLALRWRSCSAIEKPRLGMNGNGCAGSIDSGVSTGKIASMKCSSSHALSSFTRAVARTISMRFLAHQTGQQRIALLLVFLKTADLQQQKLKLLFGRASVRALDGDALADLAGKTGDANHEEFVEIGRRDRQEPHPLQKRMALVLRFVEHAAVELEPGKFAVDEAVRIAVGRRPPAHCISPVNSLAAGLSSFMISSGPKGLPGDK